MLIQPTHIFGIFHYFHLWPLTLKRHFTINVHSSILIHTVFAFKRIWLFNATAQSKKKFYVSREQMKLKQNGHIIPARIKQSFPLQPEWNNPLRTGRNGLVHFGLHEMAHFIPVGMKWSFHCGQNKMTTRACHKSKISLKFFGTRIFSWVCIYINGWFWRIFVKLQDKSLD